MYQLILTHRHELLKTDGPLSVFKNQEVRFVFRNTMVYGLTHRYMHQPKFMREGVTYSIVLEQLARGHLLMEDQSPGNAILQAERKSMQELDIPYFTANVDDRALRSHGQEIVSDYFQASSYLRIRELGRREFKCREKSRCVYRSGWFWIPSITSIRSTVIFPYFFI